MIPGIESFACGPLAVPNEVMEHVVRVESSFNPFAIGVVGGRLQRQPQSIAEAEATARALESDGRNYSVGLAQVNRINFKRFDLDEPRKAFDVCRNLRAGASILAECFERSDGEWGPAFSCYYSGNETTGYEHGYVQKIFASIQSSTVGSSEAPVVQVPTEAIAVINAQHASARPMVSVTKIRSSGEPQRAETVERSMPLDSAAQPLERAPVDPARVF